MASQATIMAGNGSASIHRAHGTEASPVTHIARDVLELGELQTNLFLLDMKSSSARIRNAVIFAIAGAIVLWMGCLIALVAGAYALVEFAGWPESGAFGAVALGAVIISALMLLAAWRIWRRGILTWDRSREELQQNIAWLKSALSKEHHAPRRATHGAYPD
jgi:Putative Actinobacterial Holin-X, holin superfamily III